MWREALSARLDGEQAHAAGGPGGEAALDAHLATCAACRQWYDDAAFITRLARLDNDASAGGSIPASILDATPGRSRARVATGLRVALALLGAGQILLAVAQVAGPMSGTDASVMHLTHEFVAWNTAIGASFLFIAWRRTRPAALLPLLTAFVAVLTVLSLDDVLHGEVSAGRLATHGLLVTGYLVVVAMSRPSMSFEGPPGARQRAQPSAWRLEVDDLETEIDAPAWRDRPDTPAASIADRERHAA